METERIALSQRERDRLRVLHEAYAAIKGVFEMTNSRVPGTRPALPDMGKAPSW
jgi:hypothetical protein